MTDEPPRDGAEIGQRTALLDRVWSGFLTLTNHQGGITPDAFRSCLKSFPELLTDEAIGLGEWLVQRADTADRKEYMQRIVAALRACRKDGVDRALFEQMLVQGRERHRLRLATLAEEVARQRAAYVPTGRAKKTELPSLGDVVDHVQRHFPQELVTVNVKSAEDPLRGNPVQAQAPRYFYRGEAGDFPATVSSLERLLAATQPPLAAAEDILRATIRIRNSLIEKWRIPFFLAEGFLQHYGLPTRYLDVTPDLNVAVSFASDLAIGDIGALCVLPLDALGREGQLIELTHQSFGERPSRQKAFVWSSKRHRNLKDPATVAALDLKWFRFEFTEKDWMQYFPNPVLLDAHSDRAAGTIEMAMNGMGKIHDAAAAWISRRIQPAPFVFLRAPDRDDGSPSCAWVSAEEAGIPYRESDRQRLNYERWSDRYPASDRYELPSITGVVKIEDLAIGAAAMVPPGDLFGTVLPAPGRSIGSRRPVSTQPPE